MAHRATLVAVAAVATLSAKAVLGHPLCYLDDSNPSLEISATYCANDEPDGFCCAADVESGLQSTLEASGASGACAEMYKEVLCGVCHPYSAHLYERLNFAEGLTMTIDYCNEFYAACSADLNLGEDYCEVHTGGAETDQYWSYPLVIDNSFDDSALIKAFPDLSDDDLPTQPMDMHMTPDGTKWWIAGLEGQIVEVDAADATSAKVVMDIADKIVLSYEEGLLGFALSPSFSESGVFYCSYTTPGTDEFAKNRLSRFTYDSSSASATSASEEVLITTTDKQSSVHSAGWVSFAPSSYGSSASSHDLYWTVGDGGPQNDPFNRAQDADEYHGSMMRITVSDTAGSGYTIPSSNPFSGGGGLGEICAWGMRNPYRCSFDRDTDDLYCGDVGHLSLESIKKIECGKNYGWRRFEGERCSDQIETEFAETCDSVDRDPYTFPEYNYCHPDYVPSDYEEYLVDQSICGDRSVIGSAVIGGYMYRGAKYGDLLGGNYIFADHTIEALYHLYPNEDGSWGYGTLLNDDTVPKISSFAEDNEGELYFIGYLGTIYEMPCGELCDGEGVNPVTEEPVAVPTPSPETAAPTTATADPGQEETVPPTPAPVETPAPSTAEPTPPRTASPFTQERPSSDVTMAPVRTETLPPAATMSPVAPVDPVVPNSPTGDPSDPAPIAPTAPTGGGGDDVPDLCSVVGDDEVPLQDAPAEISPQYLGCYKDNKDDLSTRIMQLAYLNNESMTPVVCETFCRDAGADLFGLQHGSQCVCGNSFDVDLDQHGPGSVCDRPCAGDSSASCGGYLAVDVYNIGGGQQVPKNSEYLGCMRDEKHSNDARALFEGLLRCNANMTTQICERFCRKKGAVVYGLQYGHECFCGEELDHDQYGPGVCNLRCAGDSHSTCGGYLAQNVYALHY